MSKSYVDYEGSISGIRLITYYYNMDTKNVHEEEENLSLFILRQLSSNPIQAKTNSKHSHSAS